MLTRNIYLISMFEFPHLVIFDIPVSCPLVRTIPETFMSGRDKSWLQILPGNNCQPRLFSQELFATMFKDGLLGEKENTEPAGHWLSNMVQEFIHDLIGLNITESLRNCENLRHRHCRHRGCHLTHKYFLFLPHKYFLEIFLTCLRGYRRDGWEPADNALLPRQSGGLLSLKQCWNVLLQLSLLMASLTHDTVRATLIRNILYPFLSFIMIIFTSDAHAPVNWLRSRISKVCNVSDGWNRWKLMLRRLEKCENKQK